MELSDFLNGTSHIPGIIGDAPPAPTPIPGIINPIDPMKPWRSIEVGPYVFGLRWLIKRAFAYAGEKFDPLWEADDEELDSLNPTMTEALQKCLYDLRLSRFADNPYFALLASITTLVGVKYGSIRLKKMLDDLEKREREVAQREAELRGQRRPQPSPVQTNQSYPTPSSRAELSLLRRDDPSPPPTSADSLTESFRMQASGGGYSFADSPEAGNRSSSLIESEPDDE